MSEITAGGDGLGKKETWKHRVGHHFADQENEFTANKFGFWLFLATEILLFGGLFVAYAVFRSTYPKTFHEAHEHLDKTMGAINTVVLICSSFTMAMAVRASQTNQRRRLIVFLVITLLCAFTFLVIKFFEYSAKIHHGYLPGYWYTPHLATDPANGNLFFGLYFMMTGLHGLHVLGGIVAITWILINASKRRYSSEWYTPVELVGMYWHLVDLIWIYLFPLFYLIG
jgi:cytochrome c oxidase subunit III